MALLCNIVEHCRVAAALLLFLINVEQQVLRALLCRAFNATILVMKPVSTLASCCHRRDVFFPMQVTRVLIFSYVRYSVSTAIARAGGAVMYFLMV